MKSYFHVGNCFLTELETASPDRGTAVIISKRCLLQKSKSTTIKGPSLRAVVCVVVGGDDNESATSFDLKQSNRRCPRDARFRYLGVTGSIRATESINQHDEPSSKCCQ